VVRCFASPCGSGKGTAHRRPVVAHEQVRGRLRIAIGMELVPKRSGKVVWDFDLARVAAYPSIVDMHTLIGSDRRNPGRPDFGVPSVCWPRIWGLTMRKTCVAPVLAICFIASGPTESRAEAAKVLLPDLVITDIKTITTRFVIKSVTVTVKEVCNVDVKSPAYVWIKFAPGFGKPYISGGVGNGISPIKAGGQKSVTVNA
jgi:hypothetical protein